MRSLVTTAFAAFVLAAVVSARSNSLDFDSDQFTDFTAADHLAAARTHSVMAARHTAAAASASRRGGGSRGCSADCSSNTYPGTCSESKAQCSFACFMPLDQYGTFYNLNLQQVNGQATLHGLWPSLHWTGSNGQPAACSGSVDFSDDVYNAVNVNGLFGEYWPTNQGPSKQMCFNMHEWWRHGTCTQNENGKAIDQQEYYLTAMALVEMARNNQALATSHAVTQACVSCVAQVVRGWDSSKWSAPLPIGNSCNDACQPCPDEGTCSAGGADGANADL